MVRAAATRRKPDEMADSSQLAEFMRYCEEHTGQAFADQADFHKFSVAEFRQFWSLFLAWSGVVYDGSAEPACTGDEVESATFFPEVRLNYVENLLAGHPERDDEPAVIARTADGSRTVASRRELRRAGHRRGERLRAARTRCR